MTISELYEWAKENNAENLQIIVRDNWGDLSEDPDVSIINPLELEFSNNWKMVKIDG